ncbi:helix-turn-helix domain-containing protein [Shimia thalassica]|uniref:GlxA family transcriptional regulator n=1 Tax=Shimia thalassica TaxID=1715693 RepID=UPI001C09314E|nr:helix-turn-helix domain-containing protein [Shimia thalassica]MBU2943195.1 helix-turn-helix domain-containing protein [Shimia thalassica]MDO6505322.1 helix-turn-helix domain-containing protein [Shimia thalassica]
MSETSTTKTCFVFVVENGFTMQAFSSAVEVLRVARKLGATDLFSYSVCGLDGTPVAASNEIAIVPDLDINNLPPNAIMVIVSGAGADRNPNPALISKLRFWARQARPIWALSSGVVRLAQAGLIGGCNVAPHWEDVPYLKEHHPRVDISTSLFVDNVLHPTCSGGGAAADLMLSFVRRAAPPGMIEDIASRLVMDGVRDGRIRQSLPAKMRFETTNKLVFSAVRLMENNCFEALSLQDISHRVGISQRQLERLFRKEFQKTPAKVYTELRLDEARQEVLAGHRSLIDIALDYGYQAGNFSKVYQRVFGVLPSEDRKKPVPDMS